MQQGPVWRDSCKPWIYPYPPACEFLQRRSQRWCRSRTQVGSATNRASPFVTFLDLLLTSATSQGAQFFIPMARGEGPLKKETWRWDTVGRALFLHSADAPTTKMSRLFYFVFLRHGDCYKQSHASISEEQPKTRWTNSSVCWWHVSSVQSTHVVNYYPRVVDPNPTRMARSTHGRSCPKRGTRSLGCGIFHRATLSQNPYDDLIVLFTLSSLFASLTRRCQSTLPSWPIRAARSQMGKTAHGRARVAFLQRTPPA